MPKGFPGRPKCTIDGCDKPNDARGYCRKHYQRLMRVGDPTIGEALTRDEVFARNYIVTPSGCWQWTAALVSGGYAAFWDGAASITGHRWSYQRFIGPIPDELHIDHLCRNRSCVNPLHLEAVTLKENVLRGNGISAQNARKTHCKRGHEFDESNTYIDAFGSRICRKCKALWARTKSNALAAS